MGHVEWTLPTTGLFCVHSDSTTDLHERCCDLHKRHSLLHEFAKAPSFCLDSLFVAAALGDIASFARAERVGAVGVRGAGCKRPQELEIELRGHTQELKGAMCEAFHDAYPTGAMHVGCICGGCICGWFRSQLPCLFNGDMGNMDPLTMDKGSNVPNRYG